jgi:hypothetical protein
MLRNDGLGGCTCGRSTGATTPVGPFQPCRDFFPGIPCASYQGRLYLYVVYNSTSPFVDPDFQSCLNTVGLGDITALWALSLHIFHIRQVPRDVKLAFLPGLTLAKDQIALSECNIEGDTCAAVWESFPFTPRLVGVPDLANVYRTRDLFIQNTKLSDMTSFGSLKCPPDIIQIYGNKELKSLRGLEGFGPWTRDLRGNIIVIYPSPGEMSALSTMYLCDNQGNSVLTGGFISIRRDECSTLLQVRRTYLCRAFLYLNLLWQCLHLHVYFPWNRLHYHYKCHMSRPKHLPFPLIVVMTLYIIWQYLYWKCHSQTPRARGP